MKKFYVIHTKPKQEIRAIENLNMQGFKTWMPFFKKTILFKNKYITKREPFFPGYVFVLLDIIKQDWSKINNTFGVKYLVTIGGCPNEIKLESILTLKKIMMGEYININDNVQVLSGKLLNKQGKVLKMCSNNRVKLLLETLSVKMTAVLNKKILYKV